MAVLNSVDRYYNKEITNDWYIKHFEPVGVDFGYRYKLLFQYDEEVRSIVQSWELRSQYSYIFSTGLIDPTKEQVFANFYVTYLSFAMALEFRIYSMYLHKVFGEKNYYPQSYACNELANYMYLFAFNGFKKKLFDFKKVMKDDPELRDKTKYEKILFYMKNPRTENLDVEKMIIEEKVVHYFKDYDLSFVMDMEFLKKMSKVFPDINVESIPLSRAGTSDQVEPQLESFLLAGLQFTDQLVPVKGDAKTIRRNHYNNLWKLFKNSFPQLGLIRMYFQNVFTGEHNKKALDFNSFVPDYEVAKEIWDLLEIFQGFHFKSHPATEKSWIRSIHKGRKIFRNNALQIMRKVLEIKTGYYIKKLSKTITITDDDKLQTDFYLSERKTKKDQKYYGHIIMLHDTGAESSTAAEEMEDIQNLENMEGIANIDIGNTEDVQDEAISTPFQSAEGSAEKNEDVENTLPKE